MTQHWAELTCHQNAAHEHSARTQEQHTFSHQSIPQIMKIPLKILNALPISCHQQSPLNSIGSPALLGAQPSPLLLTPTDKRPAGD